MLFFVSEVPLLEGDRVGCAGCMGAECEERVLDGPASEEEGSKGRI